MNKILSLSFILLFVNQLIAENYKFTAKVYPDSVNFAKIFTVEISTEIPKDSLFFVLKIPNNQTIALKDSTLTIKETDKTKSITLKLHYLPFSIGHLPIADFVFQIGTRKYKLDTLWIDVLPLEIDSEQVAKIDTTKYFKIFDVKQPIGAPFTFKEFWLRFRYLILALLLLILLALLIYWLLKKYKQNKRYFQPAKFKQVDPVEWTLAELNKLAEKKLCQHKKFKEFYFRLSEILRWYFEKRFNFSALEMTTSELKTFLQNTDFLNEELFNKTFDILQTADLVKFANLNPLPSVCQHHLDEAKAIVEQTKPVEEQAAEESKPENQEE